MTEETGDNFANEKAAKLIDEAKGWDTSDVSEARPDDIPIIDVSGWLAEETHLNRLAQPEKQLVNQLREASEEVGFYSLVGHGIEADLRQRVFACAQQFHGMDLEQKLLLAMDQEGSPSGIGYLPVKHKKLPKRATGNENEAFIIKRDVDLSLNQNLWPTANLLPEFRQTLEAYAQRLEHLAKSLLPLYAAALEMPLDFFSAAFTNPLYRLRLTHYPIVQRQPGAQEAFGIAPHVDTTFFTILAQNEPGLAVFNERRKCWIQVPLVPDAFVVNTGELLKQWTNDRFISVKHFANNRDSQSSRYSVPYFFNANSDYPMACIPSCTSLSNPPKYPTISYAQSQGVVQGE